MSGPVSTPREPAGEVDPAPTRWKHRKGDLYAAGRHYPQGNPEQGYWWETWLDSVELSSLAQAKRAGFAAAGSDDFNIIAIRGGKVVAVLWMDEVLDWDDLSEWEAARDR